MKYIRYVFALAIPLLGCQQTQLEWPKYITEAMWVPKGAQEITYYTLKGSYQVRYDVKVCFPADDFIVTLVNEMGRRAWKRLDIDFLNPGLRLNHAREFGGAWSHFYDKNGREIYQWIEDWEDSQRNVVRYYLRYQPKNGIIADECWLRVVAIFTPAECR